jgi:hypothetical protein
MDNIWSTLSRSKYGTKLIIASKSPKKKLTPVALNMTPNSTEIKQDKLPLSPQYTLKSKNHIFSDSFMSHFSQQYLLCSCVLML